MREIPKKISALPGCVMTKIAQNIDAKLVGSEFLSPLSCLYGYFSQNMILCALYSRKVELAHGVCFAAYTVLTYVTTKLLVLTRLRAKCEKCQHVMYRNGFEQTCIWSKLYRVQLGALAADLVVAK